MTVVLGGIAAAGDLPRSSRPGMPTQGNFLAAVLIVIFGFFFVTVSSRITGLIGSSSNPISGMTIATLILTCLHLRRARLDRRRLRADRALRRRHRLHRGRQRRQHVAGSEDRLHRRRDADLSADRPDHRRHRLGARHRLDDALPARGVRHRIGGDRRAAGDADGDDHQGPAQPEPAVGPRARRRVHRRSRSSCAASTRCRSPSARTCRSPRRRRSSPAAWCGGTSSARPGSTEESDVSAGTLFSSGLIAGGSLAASCSPCSSAPRRSRRSRRSATRCRSCTARTSLGHLLGAALFLALAAILARAPASARWT